MTEWSRVASGLLYLTVCGVDFFILYFNSPRNVLPSGMFHYQSVHQQVKPITLNGNGSLSSQSYRQNSVCSEYAVRLSVCRQSVHHSIWHFIHKRVVAVGQSFSSAGIVCDILSFLLKLLNLVLNINVTFSTRYSPSPFGPAGIFPENPTCDLIF